MNKKIEGLLEDYCKGKGWPRWRDDEELLEILRNIDEVHKKMVSEHRHWDEYRYTIKIGNAYIGYIYAKTTGDMSPEETGYDFEPDLCEMKPMVKTITTYIKKEEE